MQVWLPNCILGRDELSLFLNVQVFSFYSQNISFSWFGAIKLIQSEIYNPTICKYNLAFTIEPIYLLPVLFSDINPYRFAWTSLWSYFGP